MQHSYTHTHTHTFPIKLLFLEEKIKVINEKDKEMRKKEISRTCDG